MRRTTPSRDSRRVEALLVLALTQAYSGLRMGWIASHRQVSWAVDGGVRGARTLHPPVFYEQRTIQTIALPLK